MDGSKMSLVNMHLANSYIPKLHHQIRSPRRNESHHTTPIDQTISTIVTFPQHQEAKVEFPSKHHVPK
jgi:hypothetical protein